MVQCYFKSDSNPNLIKPFNSGVCMGSGSAAGFYSCCFPWDQCLPDGLCYANSSSTYYTSLCTDQTLQDSACQKGCNGIYRTGVTYNSTVDLWACCDKDDPSCSTSTNATFKAPAPDSLRQHTMTIVDFIPTATSTTTGATATSSSLSSLSLTTTITASSSSQGSSQGQQVSDASHGLGAGAIAGISIGAAIVIVALIAALFFWRRTKRNRHFQGFNVPPTYDDTGAGTGTVEKYSSYVVEAPTPHQYHQPKPVIPPQRTTIHELN